MSNLREVMQQALEALEIGYDAAKEYANEYHRSMSGYNPRRHAAIDADVQKIADAIAAVKAALLTEVSEAQMAHAAALAEPEQEPFGFFQYSPHLDAWVQNRNGKPGTAFYTHPPQRKPLTDEEIADLWDAQIFHIDDLKLAIDFVRAIEAAHGIKQEEA